MSFIAVKRGWQSNCSIREVKVVRGLLMSFIVVWRGWQSNCSIREVKEVRGGSSETDSRQGKNYFTGFFLFLTFKLQI